MAIKPRWKKIMDLPPGTQLYDMSTGQRYAVSQFRPIHRSQYDQRVDEFELVGSDERVYVPFLRLLGDRNTCSLQAGGSA